VERIFADAAVPLLQAMTTMSAGEAPIELSNKRVGHSLFPRLHSLCLRNIHFQSDEEYGKPVHDMIIPLLRKLQERRRGIQYLEIEYCKIDEQEVRAFEEIVPEVEWDGDIYGIWTPSESGSESS